MKFLFKISFLFLCVPALKANRDIFVITHHQNKHYAKRIKKMMVNKYYIHPNLIRTLDISSPCSKLKQVIMQICIDEFEDIEIVQYQKDIVRNSFKTFIEKE